MKYPLPENFDKEENDEIYKDGFDVSEEEIIFLWQSVKTNGLTSDQAWHAIVTGMALDQAFERNKRPRLDN